MRSSGSLQNKLLSVSLFRKNFLGAAILFSVIFFCKDDFFWKKAFAGGKGNLRFPPPSLFTITFFFASQPIYAEIKSVLVCRH